MDDFVPTFVFLAVGEDDSVSHETEQIPTLNTDNMPNRKQT